MTLNTFQNSYFLSQNVLIHIPMLDLEKSKLKYQYKTNYKLPCAWENMILFTYFRPNLFVSPLNILYVVYISYKHIPHSLKKGLDIPFLITIMTNYNLPSDLSYLHASNYVKSQQVEFFNFLMSHGTLFFNGTFLSR